MTFQLCEIARRERNGIDPTVALLIERTCPALTPEPRAWVPENSFEKDRLPITPAMRRQLQECRDSLGWSWRTLDDLSGVPPTLCRLIASGIRLTVGRSEWAAIRETCEWAATGRQVA